MCILVSKLKDAMSRQFRKPTKGILGRVALQFLKTHNSSLEKNAARLSAIEPHHMVLELGFGPGIGIEHALQNVKDGPGKICGVDLSPYMVEKASKQLHSSILDKKVELNVGSVMEIPYSADTFHRVFHCNCYYFWPSMQDALQEIYRVMKSDSMMVTVLNKQCIEAGKAKGYMKYGNPDPVRYMCALETSGFSDVRMEYFKDGSMDFQAIFAHLPVKTAVQSNLSSGKGMSSNTITESREYTVKTA